MMKKSVFYVFVLMLLFVLTGYCLYSISELHRKLNGLEVKTQPEPEEDVEVAEIMNHLNRHTSKLDLAIASENWPLAEFYMHEAEEVLEVFEKTDVIDEELNLSTLYQSLLKGNLQSLESQVKAKDVINAKAAMQTVWNSCNTCHEATNHSFIVVKSGSVDQFPNQQFKVNSAN